MTRTPHGSGSTGVRLSAVCVSNKSVATSATLYGATIGLSYRIPMFPVGKRTFRVTAR
jgi:hypothetical protein